MLFSNFRALVCALCALASLVSGCAVYDAPNQAQQWLNQQNATVVAPVVQVFPVPQPVVPQVYLPPAEGSPFSTERMGRTGRHSLFPSTQVPGMAFEWQRQPQPLELFPLDSMVMVGVLQQDGTPVALIRANQAIHVVHKGQYLGQNFGLIQAIQPHAIQLREMIQDAHQHWVERAVTLQLQEENRP
jgi:type IV pilus assembly protein PilP